MMPYWNFRLFLRKEPIWNKIWFLWEVSDRFNHEKTSFSNNKKNKFQEIFHLYTYIHLPYLKHYNLHLLYSTKSSCSLPPVMWSLKAIPVDCAVLDMNFESCQRLWPYLIECYRTFSSLYLDDISTRPRKMLSYKSHKCKLIHIKIFKAKIGLDFNILFLMIVVIR